MEGQEMANATLRECSVGQPKYRVEVYYDSQGVCYLRDGWSKFFIDYGMHEGWFLSSLVVTGRKLLPSASSTVPSPPVPSPPGREGRISSTSSAGFSRAKSMRRSRHVEEGEHLLGKEHFVLLG
jgi:hypothetical protein